MEVFDRFGIVLGIRLIKLLNRTGSATEILTS